MKINPVGINAYQQVAHTGKSGHTNNIHDTAAAKLTVQLQNSSEPSRISVKPRIADAGTAMNLSERNALNNLLKVISEKNASNPAYARDNRVQENSNFVGKLVDVKV